MNLTVTVDLFCLMCVCACVRACLCVTQPGSVPMERGSDPEGQSAVGHQRRGDGPTPGPRPGHSSSGGKRRFPSESSDLLCKSVV